MCAVFRLLELNELFTGGAKNCLSDACNLMTLQGTLYKDFMFFLAHPPPEMKKQ